jgi:hypothetical protein
MVFFNIPEFTRSSSSTNSLNFNGVVVPPWDRIHIWGWAKAESMARDLITWWYVIQPYYWSKSCAILSGNF